MSVAPELCFLRRSSFLCILAIASDELVDGGGGGGTNEDDENVDEDEDEEDEDEEDDAKEEEEEAEEASLAGARAPPTAPITGGAVTGASETLALDTTRSVEEELLRPAVRSAAIATSRAAPMSSVRCLLRESTRA